MPPARGAVASAVCRQRAVTPPSGRVSVVDAARRRSRRWPHCHLYRVGRGDG